jgi:hypothetical protein
VEWCSGPYGSAVAQGSKRRMWTVWTCS